MKSFLQGKKTLTTAPLRPPPALAVAHSARICAPEKTLVAKTSGGGGAAVEVVKEGDKVIRLIVTCACGERVEIECLYPAGS